MPRRSATKITKARVDALEPGQSLWDAEIPGFGVRAQSHSKTYVLKTVVQGGQRWLTIGKHGAPRTADQARKRALELLADIGRGLDPEVERQTILNRPRVQDLCERYLREHARPMKKASSARMDEKNIQNHVLPLLGNLWIESVTTADIEAFKEAVRVGRTKPKDPKAQVKAQGGGSVVTGGTGVANRCLALLSKMFALAERWGLRPRNSNPVQDVQRYKEHPRERFLTVEEFGRLGEILIELEDRQVESPYVVAAIRLLILTGARLSEVLTLRWSYIDLERQRARLPDSKTGARSIHLSEAAVEVLVRLPRFVNNPYVIVGGRERAHLKNLQKPWGRIRRALGLPDLRLHDLRHSFASVAATGGVPLQVIGKLLGHAKTATTERYAHLTSDHVGRTSEDVGNALRLLLAPTMDVKRSPV